MEAVAETWTFSSQAHSILKCARCERHRLIRRTRSRQTDRLAGRPAVRASPPQQVQEGVPREPRRYPAAAKSHEMNSLYHPECSSACLVHRQHRGQSQAKRHGDPPNRAARRRDGDAGHKHLRELAEPNEGAIIHAPGRSFRRRTSKSDRKYIQPAQSMGTRSGT